MDAWTILVDLTVLLSAALVLGALCERVRQSAIVGYLIAGMLLGPNALQVISSGTEVDLLAELGVALLLFAIGLEFSWRRLRAMGFVSLGGGVAQIMGTAAVGAGCAAALGLSGKEAIVIGAMIALSSTASVLRVLQARNELESVHGTHALGVLLVQDLAVIPCVLLVTVLVQDGSGGSIAINLAQAFLLAALAAVALYVVFTFVVPRVLQLGSVSASRELSVLTAIVSALGAILLAHKTGLSPGLGAFIAGILLGGSPFAAQVRADMSALRTLFVTVFFSSIGALGDPVWMLANWQILLPTVLAILLTKSLVAWGALRLFGAGAASALAAGVCIAQIGEFSFIMAEIARGTLLSDEVFLLLVSATVITMFLTPFLVAAAPKVAGYLLRSSGSDLGSEPEGAPPQNQVLVIGFGPAGRVVGDQVREGGGQVVILDLNPHGVASARRLGFTAFLGDGQHEDILLHAGVRDSKVVVVTVPAPAVAVDIVRIVRFIAPEAAIVARARYNRHYSEIADAGAQVVHDEETHLGILLATSVLEALQPAEAVDGGVSPESDSSDAAQD
ncbi:cation:proton antiporter [Engelhardtia mirabilis]|uniref:Inner membrane protein YbaL n=1 Tax=Engelhardtia mirabilis TaxID=2528011 RepID=A0A518BGU9_9BACT|nr:Inner membrane protein YbaL [Planctomycetes bacterium Pla133]QDV00529.1 Inner membrane protein YbaL [Planctomycetes bacterium Pla86]